jgi:folate-binding protein YgfZ
MSELTAYPLEHLAILTISGQDSVKFLQGQCTQDINLLVPERASPGAFCSAKGRTITNVWLIRTADAEPVIHLCCHRSSAARLSTHLSRYIAFFRGTLLTDNSERFQGFGLMGPGSDDWVQTLPSMPASHFRCQGPDGRWLFWLDTHSELAESVLVRFAPLLASDASAWQVADITNEILWLTADQIEKWIPQNFGLDRQGGISFKKGCYTGQEVIARLHFKGASKKNLFRLQWHGQQPSADGKIYQGSLAIGEIVQQAATLSSQLVLAILKVEPTRGTLYADENQQLVVELLE